jgi:hypothetical protein
MDADATDDIGAIMNNSAQPTVTAGPAITRTRPALWTRLPAGHWQVRFWEEANGQALLDVVAPDGTLARRLIAALGPPPSIEACWAGCNAGGPGSHDDGQCWALAVGHAPTGRGHIVSFAPRTLGFHRSRVTMPFESSSGLWITHRGLWVAAIGCYTHVRLTAHPQILLRPLTAVTNQSPDRMSDASLQ